MSTKSGGSLATLTVVVLLLQIALSAATIVGASSDGEEDRLPSGYLAVFQDNFDSGVLDPTKWVYWDGMWSTDNIAINPSGGFYTGDDWYMTESPFGNEFGSPLDDNGNDGIYYPEQRVMMETAWIDLRNLTQPRLEFDHMYDIPSPGDGALVYVMTDDDQEWALVEPDSPYPEATGWSGTVQAWVHVSFRLDAYADERIRVGFYFRSSPDGIEGDGWKIDDVEVGGRSGTQLADLRLGNTRILLDGYPVEAAVAGDVLQLNMTILNEGRAHAPAFVVSAYTDHPLVGGEEIGRQVILEGLSVGTSTNVNMRWVAIAGEYDILVTIDRTNAIPEENEENNDRIVELSVDDTSSGDIAVTDLHFEADGVTIHGAGVGDLINIVATLSNVGTSIVSTPLVVRACDGDHGPGAEPIGDTQPKYNGLEPGGVRTIEIPWRPLEGVHTIFLVAAPQDPAQLLDFNNDNNITWATLSVTDEPEVDLMVVELLFLLEGSITTLASQGDSVHMVTTVGNVGTGTYEGVLEVGIYRGDPDAGGQAIGSQLIIAELAPDETLTIEFDWRVDLGTHAITIFVDPGNLVHEANEYNNQLGKGLTVSRSPLPDLTLAAMDLLLNGIELDPSVGTNEGADVEVNITVWNAGNEKTKSATKTSLYLGNPRLGEGTEVGFFRVPEGLNPDEVFVSSIFWTAERPKQRGEVPVLFVEVDSTHIEPEVTEFNNLDLRPLMVGTKLPDLHVASVSITDMDGVPTSSMTYGTSISIEVISTNIGTDISFQVAQLSLFLDQVDPANRITTISTSTMGIGETITKSVTWTPDPSEVSGGDHIIIAVIDPQNEIEESSDANNNMSAPIFVDSNALPNLLLQDIWVTKGEKAIDSIDKGEKATVHLRILNLGQAPLFTTTSVELFHGDPTQGGEQVAIWSLSDMPVMGNASFEVEWTFERTAPLTVFIDRNHVVDETNEQDNHGTAELVVKDEAEGPNWLIIGAVLAIGVVVFLIMTSLLRRSPIKPAEEGVEEGAEGEAEEEKVAEEEEEDVEEPTEEPSAEPDEEPAEEPEGEPVEESAEATEETPAEEEGSTEEAATPTCPSCGKELDPDWILCPFCDKPLY
jgi:subtilase family serine protease